MNQPVTLDPSVLERLVVAIDGPSGSGKSTVARGVATRLSLRYLDTGAMYRALTWLALRENVDLADGAALTDLADRWQLSISTDAADPTVTVGEIDVTSAVRADEVTASVSAVSAVPGVRARLVQMQRDIADCGGIVVEGRDIGTVVFPAAPVKVFLTASGQARALRRARETLDGPGAGDVAITQAALERRDRLDSGRSVSPLARAQDAIEIDTTAMGVEQVIDAVLTAALAAAVSSGAPPRRR